ncbi:hypothetical protein [Desulfovibrio sp. SGI.169]|uniref:hypothetical protein n=1 Tax=Desulfovibrio sp. SGI.169 TaxID=3420561 RepID=UPI003D03BA95
MRKELFIVSLFFLGIIGWCGNAGANSQRDDNRAKMTAFRETIFLPGNTASI